MKAAAAAALLSAAGAQAAVIDFDADSISQLTHTNLSGPLSLINVFHGNSYVEEGFLLQSSLNVGPISLPNTLFAPDAVNVLFTPAADSYALAASAGAKTTLTLLGGGAFNATSIDLATLLDVGGQSRSVTFTGTKADASGTVVKTFNFASDWHTFSFGSGFTNLSQITWTESLLVNRDFLVDNISVTAVPEPSTYAMLFAGLGLVGFFSRRRQSIK